MLLYIRKMGKLKAVGWRLWRWKTVSEACVSNGKNL